LATVTDAIHQLQAAEATALSRTKGAATTRNERRVALTKQLQQLKNHVQTTADTSPDTSASIVQSAGIAVKKTAVRPPRVFTAKPGAVSGSVHLITKTAARRASYDWQYSTDGGKTWIPTPSTLQSKTTISGLAPGATVVFRSRPVTKHGEGDWSQPTSLIVK
ncbi:MAG: fibronectin type III domain-containing protein, partial [Myxococcales bacterium]|nr:fibronectin type III domain-containing protein [Myxococcales bacterium]